MIFAHFVRMAITWYKDQSTAESCNFGAQAVIWPLLERMGVAKIINQHLPADPQAEYDHGGILSLLVAARLYGPVALVNVAQWAGESGADILWDIPVEKITDDRLAKSLDAFFTQRHSILASAALTVSHGFGVSLSEVHYDPTHILLHGAYEGSEPREESPPGEVVRSDDQLPPAHITTGRPMSDAPKDVRMIHAGLCTVVDEWGPLPIFGHTVDGNRNGHTAVAEQLALWKKHLKPAELTLISDRGTFSAGHLLRLSKASFSAIVAAPWNEFRALFDEQQKRLQWKRAQLPVDRAAAAANARKPAPGTLRSGRGASYVGGAGVRGKDSLPGGLRVEHDGSESRAKESREVREEDSRRLGTDPAERGGGALKTPRRVEALVFLMLISLTLYFLLQRLYRQSVPSKASAKEKRTTTATILRAFSNYTLLIHKTRLGREVQPTRLTTRQLEVLNHLGFDTPAQILSHRLPRGP